MRVKYRQIINKLKLYIKEYFDRNQGSGICFHDLDHTTTFHKDVVKMGAHYGLNKEDAFILEVASLFSDASYIENTVDNGAGNKFVTEFLKGHNVNEALITKVNDFISGKKKNGYNDGLSSEIFYDARHIYLGKSSFETKNELLRKETEFLQNSKISKSEWRKESIQVLGKFNYQTEYCMKKYNQTKEANLQKVRIQLEGEQPIYGNDAKAEELKNTEKSQKKGAKSDRSVEIMFKITSSNNQRQSTMADNKAHILITVNSIILSAVISLALRKLEGNYFLALPTFGLLGISVVSLAFAIMATRPSVPNGKFSMHDLEEHNVNLLFFGNFFRMKLEEYRLGMRTVMEDMECINDMLIMDLFLQGVVIGKKYGLLKMAYNIFMYGLIVIVVAFVIVVLTNHSVPAPNITPVK